MNRRHVKRLDELAQELPPARDLWPAISAAIESRTAAEVVETPRTRAGWWPVSAVAAALALVTFGVWIGRSIGPEVANDNLTASTARPSDMTPAAFERDEKYRRTRESLLAEAQQRLAAMPSEERERVSASLATLRRSIAEIEAALGRDPANTLLQELLVSSCQEEMRVLNAVRNAGGLET